MTFPDTAALEAGAASPVPPGPDPLASPGPAPGPSGPPGPAVLPAPASETVARAGDGPTSAPPPHHVGRFLLCRPTWRVPWLAPLRVILLLLVAGAAKAVADLGAGDSTIHRVAVDAQWPAVALAALVALHPVAVRALFRRVRTGVPVTVAWAGRDRSGQPWLVLRTAEGTAWRVRPRPGPVEYPLPRWRGTAWVYPPEVDAGPVSGTLVRPRFTRRRGLVVHRTAPGPGTEGGQDVYSFGSQPESCLGLHLRTVRRLRRPR